MIYRRKSDGIAREARLDGVYVARTSVPAAALGADETVQAYKDLGPGGHRPDMATLKNQGLEGLG